MVVVGRPGGVVVVLDNWIGQAKVAGGLLDVTQVFFEGKFGCVDAYNDKSLIFVFVVPRFNERQGALAVDASVCPEVDEDDFAP